MAGDGYLIRLAGRMGTFVIIGLDGSGLFLGQPDTVTLPPVKDVDRSLADASAVACGRRIRSDEEGCDRIDHVPVVLPLDRDAIGGRVISGNYRQVADCLGTHLHAHVSLEFAFPGFPWLRVRRSSEISASARCVPRRPVVPGDRT